jgi:hypothetical protein
MTSGLTRAPRHFFGSTLDNLHERSHPGRVSAPAQVWPHRVFVQDARGHSYLRVTYHEQHRLFVISTWDGTTCVAAVQVPVSAAPEVIALLANGLGSAATLQEPPSREQHPAGRLMRLKGLFRPNRRSSNVIPFERS